MSEKNRNTIVEQHVFSGKTPVRIEQFAREVIITINSNKGIKKAILRGELKVNNEKIGTEHWMQKGQTLYLHRPTDDLPIYKKELKVLFEDDHLAVVFKPSGLSMHNNQLSNFINALPFNLKLSPANDALARPYPIHRLDQQTSGLIVVAKTRAALTQLNENLKNGLIDKFYIAFVNGIILKNGEINYPIEGKKSQSKYWLVEQFERNERKFTRLRLQAVTGRTHQLRIHLSEIGHSIVGDRIHGNKERLIKGRGLMLCANEISFEHPVSNEKIQLSVDLPGKFKKFKA